MIIEKLEKIKPGENFVITAVTTLKTLANIEQFYDEYIQWLKEKGKTPEVRNNPERVAAENIGYILGYCNRDVGERWLQAKSEISHPVFGRKIYDISPKEAFELGIKIGSGEILLEEFSEGKPFKKVHRPIELIKEEQ